MLLNYRDNEAHKAALEEMRQEVLAMLKVCFEGEIVDEGNRIRVELPEGRAYSVYVSED